jgi:acetylornithine/N-succinyldiaminopimelate aminotransferase
MIGIELEEGFGAVDVKHGCLERHLLVTAIGDSVIRLVPPLIITQEDCDEACRIIGSTIEALAES